MLLNDDIITIETEFLKELRRALCDTGAVRAAIFVPRYAPGEPALLGAVCGCATCAGRPARAR